MTRVALAVAVTATSVLTQAATAISQGPPPTGSISTECLRKQSRGGWFCPGDWFKPGSPVEPTNSGGPQVTYVPYPQLWTDADGNSCVRTGYRPEGSPRPSDEAPETVPGLNDERGNDLFSIYYQTYPRCPASEGEAADTPAAYAARFWEEADLPKPSPHIAPGWAIVGKRMYLETNGSTSQAYHNPNTPFGTLTVLATGAYYVDWGDGEKSGPYSFEGKPWPDGYITHDYIWSGTYDVVVTQRWSATWHFGENSGVLRDLQTTGRIEGFPAREIQAVVGPVPR
jgi:hypothetical protein